MLNERTVKDSYALPRMEEIFDCLHGAKYFSTLDMKSGYHQVEVEESHKERTAFTVGSIGFFEYNKMPFGLCNAPATYQRLMQDCLGNLNLTICLIYLDDIIIFSDTFEQHIERVNIVLERLKAYNLKLAPDKCFFFQPKIKFLGHIVTSEGVETDPEKIEKVKNWPNPKNSDELRSFLAFAGYYRRFIKNFSHIIKPLSELLPPTSTKKAKQKQKLKVEWEWNDNHQKTFEHLKELLTEAPILAYPDFTKPFELHTDASTKALGAVLYQLQEGKKRVIAFASRSLNKAERNYSAFKLEFLALKWAITEKFSDYLVTNHFTVLTDNNPLTHILTNAKLDATGQRWASALGEYSFDIFYRPGLKNADADGMSRYPYHEEGDEEERVRIDDKSVKAVCSCMIRPAYIEVLPSASMNIVEAFEENGQVLAQKDIFEIRKSQRQDPVIETWRKAVIDQVIPRKYLKKEDLTMKRNFKNFKMKRGILFRTVQDGNREIEQLVLPDVYKSEVLKGIHDDVGHPGIERTARLVRERFFWPGMLADVESHVKKCNRCIRRKTKTNQRAPLHSVNTTYPLELVCMDFLTLEPAREIGNILVITDHYTKYALAIPTKNQTAKTTAEIFYNHFIVNYGIPTRIHSDQGANFESEIIKELCKLTNMKKSRTTPYHPQGNAGPERFNRTLLDMLGTLEASQKENWKKYVSSLTFAYNSTPHETRLSPYELMFGRRPKLPIDSVFESARQESSGNKVAQEYISDLKQRMEKTREIVKEHIEKSKSKQKRYYDKKAKSANISVGDKVLVRKMAFNGKHKIEDRFEEEVYTVEEQPNADIPVFKIKSGDKSRTLHRNLLIVIDNDDSKFDEDEKNKTTAEATKSVESSEQDEIINKDEGGRVERKIQEKGDVTDEDEENCDCDDGIVNVTDQDGDAHLTIREERRDMVPESQDISKEAVIDSPNISRDTVTESRKGRREIADKGRESLHDSRDTHTVNVGKAERIVVVTSDAGDCTDKDDLHPETNVDVVPDDVVDVTEPLTDEFEMAEETNVSEKDTELEETDVLEITSKVTKNEDDSEQGVLKETRREASVLERESARAENYVLTGTVVSAKGNEGKDAAEIESIDDEESTVRKPPTPRPRQSLRPKQVPKRFGEYQMYQMTARPYDCKLKAVDTLLKSGVLNEIDSDTAHRILASIF